MEVVLKLSFPEKINCRQCRLCTAQTAVGDRYFHLCTATEQKWIIPESIITESGRPEWCPLEKDESISEGWLKDYALTSLTGSCDDRGIIEWYERMIKDWKEEHKNT